ncbi:MAG: NADH-quinone oxidoreductase subunit L, partial [Bryobacteraceae bacterium]
LEPVFVAKTADEAAAHGHHDTGVEWMLMGLSVTLAVAGIALARHFYHARPEIPDRLEARFGPIHRLLLNKWYLDEIYDFLFVNGLCKGGGRLLGKFDNRVIDGGVNGAGWLTRFSSDVSIWWDTWIIDGFVRLSSFSVKLLSYPVRILQTGQVQAYALFVVLGVIFAFGYYVVGR